MKLCGRCAAMKKAAGIKLRRINGSIDEKVECQLCGCRRYGGEEFCDLPDAACKLLEVHNG